jgi:hypothetical protein
MQGNIIFFPAMALRNEARCSGIAESGISSFPVIGYFKRLRRLLKLSEVNNQAKPVDARMLRKAGESGDDEKPIMSR